jgi:hypothetical protein
MINANTIKKELRALNLNPKDFFIYNDGVTITVSANGTFVNCVEERKRKMHSGTSEGIEILERVQAARKITKEVFEEIKDKFNCQMAGHTIDIKR